MHPVRAFALVLLAAAPAAAKEVSPAVIKKLTRAGAFTADVRGKASFRVPLGYRYATGETLADLAAAFEYPVGDDEVGMLLPDDNAWMGFVITPKADPLAGGDPTALNPDALKAWEEKYAAARRGKRQGGVAVPSKVMGWTHQPQWDADKKRLTMGVRLTADTGESAPDVIRYHTFVYGPDAAFVGLEVITKVDGWNKPVAEAAKLAGEFTITGTPAEGGEDDPSLHYLKVGGGGIAGAVVVLVLVRSLGGRRGSAPPPGRPAGRRPGLPR